MERPWKKIGDEVWFLALSCGLVSLLSQVSMLLSLATLGPARVWSGLEMCLSDLMISVMQDLTKSISVSVTGLVLQLRHSSHRSLFASRM